MVVVYVRYAHDMGLCVEVLSADAVEGTQAEADLGHDVSGRETIQPETHNLPNISFS